MSVDAKVANWRHEHHIGTTWILPRLHANVLVLLSNIRWNAMELGMYKLRFMYSIRVFYYVIDFYLNEYKFIDVIND